MREGLPRVTMFELTVTDWTVEEAEPTLIPLWLKVIRLLLSCLTLLQVPKFMMNTSLLQAQLPTITVI